MKRSFLRLAVLMVLGAVAGSGVAAAQTAPLNTGPQSFWATVEQKDRSIYFAAIENGDAENWFGPLVGSGGTEVPLVLTHLDQAAPSAAQIEVRLQGVTTDDTVAPDHIVAVSVNGGGVGRLRFDGRALGAQRLAVPHTLLQEGINTVRLVAEGVGDYSLVDAVSLSYWHTYRADADRLRFTLEGPRSVRVTGFASGAIHILDVTDPDAPQMVEGSVAPESGGYWSVDIEVRGTGTRTLLAFTDATAAAPAFVETNHPSSLNADTQASDYLVITHDTFLEPLEPLVAMREGQGHVAALIDIEDIYDEFSFGQKDPQAVKDFLTWAQTTWRRPPAYVVLAGDATIDPRDYAGFGDADFVPTKLVAMDSVELETSTDDWFADKDGDGLADLAMGRLPIRTVVQAKTMVSKLVSYEQAPAGAWTKEVLVLTDQDDSTWSFSAQNARLESTLPDDYTMNEVLGNAGTAGARAELFGHVSNGQLLVNYLGHGSTTVWGKNGDLLTSADLAGPWNAAGRLPLVVAMNCLNGLFHGIYGEESLAEAFMRSPNGAVATWASSSITNARPQALANQEFFRLLFEGTYSTLGETMRAAKAVVTDRDVRRSWIFFGDPAMRLKGVPNAENARDRLTSVTTPSPVLAGVDPASATPSETDGSGSTDDPEPTNAPAQRLADFSGDGRDDLFTYAPDTGAWTLALADAHDFQYFSGTWAADARLVVAHLNDDRLADVFAHNEETGEWFQALNAGDGTFTTHAGSWAPGWQVTVGNLSGTGPDNLFLSHPETGVWFRAAADGSGGFSYRSGQGLPAGQVHIADFNGDQHADLFVYNPSTGRWFFGVNDTAGDFSYVGGSGAPEWRAHVANLDGNTWADLFFVDPASGAWVEWRIDAFWQITIGQGTWTAGGAVTVVDIDGNGLDDLFWYDASSGQWESHVNRGPGEYTGARGVWPAERSLGVGDLNGDRRDDLFFYDAKTGAWSRYETTTEEDTSLVLNEESGSWATGLSLVGRPQ